MKTKVFIAFNWPQGQSLEVQKLFLATGFADLLPVESMLPWKNYYDLTLDGDDPRLRGFRERLKELDKKGFSWLERQEEVYSDRELVAFPLICVSVNRAPQGNGGPTYGTTYDLSKACPVCGTGAVQTSPLVLKVSELKVPKSRDVFETLDGEIMMSPRVAQAFKESGVTEIKLLAAVSHRDSSRLAWFQLLTIYEMPPMATTTTGLKRGDPCPRCNRDGYYHTFFPMHLRYRSSEVDISKAPDVAWTWECFGNSALREPLRESHFAHPLLLVKPKVFQLLRQLKVRGLRFEPVEIISV